MTLRQVKSLYSAATKLKGTFSQYSLPHLKALCLVRIACQQKPVNIGAGTHKELNDSALSTAMSIIFCITSPGTQVFAKTYFRTFDVLIRTNLYAHGRRKGGSGALALGILKFQQKKVVFLVSSGKNKFNHFWPP